MPGPIQHCGRGAFRGTGFPDRLPRPKSKIDQPNVATTRGCRGRLHFFYFPPLHLTYVLLCGCFSSLRSPQKDDPYRRVRRLVATPEDAEANSKCCEGCQRHSDMPDYVKLTVHSVVITDPQVRWMHSRLHPPCWLGCLTPFSPPTPLLRLTHTAGFMSERKVPQECSEPNRVKSSPFNSCILRCMF